MKKIIPDDAVLVPDSAELKFQGKIFGVYQWQQRLYDGSEQTFEMLKRTDTVNAICILADGKILVLDDEQPHLGSKKSFPGGRVDPGEDIDSAIRREVLEETGYTFNNWKLIKVSQPHRKIEWFVYTYIASTVENRQDVSLDPGEKITLEAVSFDGLKGLVMSDSGYLGESRKIFEAAENLEDLMNFSQCKGTEVDR